MSKELGRHFEREIFEQPDRWEALARSDASSALAAALEGDVLLIGSGSSLFAAQLGAIALRRRGIDATAVAATEAPGDHRAYQGRTVVAISQSGRSTDVLRALDALRPRSVVALTNTSDSPLGERANVTIDVAAGPERAIPATKSVSCTIAILLTAASLRGGDQSRNAAVLVRTAETIRAWLRDSTAAIAVPAARIAHCSGIVILGTDYGVPIAREAALKFKEATYMHAEGFEAGEFRHGSAAMADPSTAAIGIVDRDGSPIVGAAMRDLAARGALRLVVGTEPIDGIERVGPIVDDPYNTLAALVTVQLLALHIARTRGVDSDAPRGLTKAIVSP
ncbi:MAG: SIS domain-containing protein [Candidatus Eremiobacteraeota bacterium]|nr:SIS domain-containing protein [Candidatus Eremiobacteraeota bacterium]